MKKLYVLLASLAAFQFFNPFIFTTISASTNLPYGTYGTVHVDKLLPSTFLPKFNNRQNKWQFHNPKLDSQLNLKLEKALLESFEKPQSSNNPALLRKNSLTENICVQVKCSAASRKTIEKKIIELNGTVTGHNINGTTIQVLIPLGSLNSLADQEFIDFVKTPDHAVTYAGNYVTEGLADINADKWHDSGIYGQNTKIGVVDVGFLGYTSLLGSDLPAVVTARNFVDGETSAQLNSGSPHGTACAEVIHDIAPQATIYLAKIYSNIDLEEAVEWLHTTCNVDIISTSLGWYNMSPGDGTGELAELVARAYNDGILWVTAAGNDQQRHWGGDFYDPDDNGRHNFTNDQDINFFGPGDGSAYLINPGVSLSIFARWSDWQNVDQDYDIYVYRNTGSGWEGPIASSVNFQNGTAGQTPTEAVSFTTSDPPAAYGFTIYRAYVDAVKIVNFEIFTPYAPRLDEILSSRSLANLADSPRATTVSAINATTYIRQDYSSEGPTNGPGGLASGGIGKPDIAAYTNVTTASYGLLGFSGTSAATPHVAGTAALILSANPTFTPGQLQSSLANQAFDMEAPGFDNTTGWGRLHLDDHAFTCVAPATISVPSQNSTGAFTISWTASTTDNVTYILEEATNSTFSSNLRQAYSGSALNTTITGKNNGTYYYRVMAVRSLYNESSWTNGNNGCQVTLTPLICVAPATISVPSQNSTGSFSISWTASTTDNVTYILEEATNSSFSSNLRQAYSGTALNTTITGRDPATYYYRVKAVRTLYTDSSWANGNNGCLVTRTCVAPTTISVPSQSSTGFFSISWTASTTDNVTYILEEATNSTFSSNLRQAYSGSALNTTITGRDPGTYYYRVKATKYLYNDSSLTNGSNGCLVTIIIPEVTTWTGYSTTWNSSGNWSNNAIPDNTSNVIVPSTPTGGYWPSISGTPAQADALTLSGPLTITYGSLTIGN